MRDIDTYDGDTSNYHFGLDDGVFVTTKQYRMLDSECDDLRTQLAEAQKDSYRLDFIQSNNLHVGAKYSSSAYLHTSEKIGFEVITDGWCDILGFGHTVREAIDNAMKGGE